MTSPLAELSASIRRLERLRTDCPERYRPSRDLVFATVKSVKAEVIALTEGGKRDQALAVVADYERQGRALLAPKLLNAPFFAETGS